MKKMLLGGCSHSAGFGLDDMNKSWGEIFAKNNNHILTNTAKPASSLQYATQSIIDQLSKANFDTVIIQLTTSIIKTFGSFGLFIDWSKTQYVPLRIRH